MGPLIVIPARSGSSRFPNKPLAVLGGQTLVARTWRIACSVPGVARVIVATDSEAIAANVRALGGEALLTPEARNGCERAAWVVQHLRLRPSVVVNLQGDAVLTPADAVAAAIGGVLGTAEQAPSEAATVAVPLLGWAYDSYLEHKAQGRSSGTTVVMNRVGQALYFSKTTLPHLRQGPPPGQPQAWRHLGLYAFTPQALARYASLAPTPLEHMEGLEQLRWLEHGFAMRVVPLPLPKRPIWSIDYPEDLAVAEDILARYGEAP